MKYWLTVLLMLISMQNSFALTAWQKIKQPVNAEPQSIGGFSNGCLIGGLALPLDHQDYQVLRSNRLRSFGHPDLIQFIYRLANRAKIDQLGTLLVGDMAMPVGGLFSSGHRSHQTGLDVDIWLQLPKQRWDEKKLLLPKSIDMVSRDGKHVIAGIWHSELEMLIKQAANDDAVARIFVHPAIKQQLCKTKEENDKSWLRKVRPWFGHRAHMHVRLNCPKANVECIDQDLPPEGDGCGAELAAWMTDSHKLPAAKPKKEPPPLPPAKCQDLINNIFKVK